MSHLEDKFSLEEQTFGYVRRKVNYGEGISYAEALALLDNPMLNPLKSLKSLQAKPSDIYRYQEIPCDIYRYLYDIATRLMPEIKIDNSIYAWYRRAMQRQNVPLMEISRIYHSNEISSWTNSVEQAFEEMPELKAGVEYFQTHVIGREADFTSVLVYQYGYLLDYPGMREFCAYALKYKEIWVNIYVMHYEDSGVSFSFNKAEHITLEQAQEVADVFFLLKTEKCFFGDHCIWLDNGWGKISFSGVEE